MMLTVVCVTILCFIWMVRDSLCGLPAPAGNTVLVATLAYKLNVNGSNTAAGFCRRFVAKADLIAPLSSMKRIWYCFIFPKPISSSRMPLPSGATFLHFAEIPRRVMSVKAVIASMANAFPRFRCVSRASVISSMLPTWKQELNSLLPLFWHRIFSLYFG